MGSASDVAASAVALRLLLEAADRLMVDEEIPQHIVTATAQRMANLATRNRDIILAAPDLLTALLLMMATNGAHGPCVNNGCDTCTRSFLAAKAAVAKAESK